jgi:hypothetical protein
MLTVNRESAIPGFGISRIRDSLTFRGFKEAQTGAAVGERGG